MTNNNLKSTANNENDADFLLRDPPLIQIDVIKFLGFKNHYIKS